MPSQLFQERENPPGIDIGLRMKTEDQIDPTATGRDHQGGNDGNFPIAVGPLPEDGGQSAAPGGPS